MKGSFKATVTPQGFSITPKTTAELSLIAKYGYKVGNFMHMDEFTFKPDAFNTEISIRSNHC